LPFARFARVSRFLAPVALAISALFLVAIAHADSVGVNFESYSTGIVDGQDGWQADGSAGSGCATYDVAVAGQATYPTFGTRSLRMSDAVTSGCFGDQTFSKPVLNEAGETSAGNDGYSGGTRQPYFQAEWDFASVQPGAEQSGLQIVASPDRGDGARMSWVQMTDTPGGLAVNFYDYQDVAPFGTSIGDPNGCGTGDDFVPTNVASGLDRTVPHHIKVGVQFVDGPRNDIAKVWVDGVLVHTGGSWEDYFRYCEGNPTRTVDSLLFRGGGTAHPANAGKGFYIDNLLLTSGPVPSSSSAVGGIVEMATGSAGEDAGWSVVQWLLVVVAATFVLGAGGSLTFASRRR
jgi:hypothetical protein